MQVYLVRLVKNQEIVGIIAANNEVELFSAVDECTDPHVCEKTILGCGGIFWGNNGAQSVPIAAEDDDEVEDLYFDGVSLCDGWTEVVYENKELVWTPVVSGNVPYETLATGGLIPAGNKNN